MAVKKLSKALQDSITETLAKTKQAPAPDFSADAEAPQTDGNVLANLAKLVGRVRELTADAILAQQNMDAIAADINRLTLITIPDAMEAAGVQSTKLTDGSTLEVKPDLNVSVTKANEAAAWAWFRENGQGAIIKQSLSVDMRPLTPAQRGRIQKLCDTLGADAETKDSVHHSTLKAVVRELLEKGITPPPSFSIYQFKRAVVKEPKK